MCGHIVESLPLDIREWTCPECETHHDRDHNAAKNIECAGGHPVHAQGENVRRTRPSGLSRKSRGTVNQSEPPLLV